MTSGDDRKLEHHSAPCAVSPTLPPATKLSVLTYLLSYLKVTSPPPV